MLATPSNALPFLNNCLQSEVSDVNSRDVMELLLITQYFDTLKDIGLSGKSNTGALSFGQAQQASKLLPRQC